MTLPHPFSYTRRRLLMEMRAAAGAPRIGSTESLLGDAIRFGFLCSQDGRQLEAMQAGGYDRTTTLPDDATTPVRLHILADRWADDNVKPSDESALVEAFLSTMAAIYHTEATDAGSDDEGGDVGESIGRTPSGR